MSMTGSLMGYDNSSDVTKLKTKPSKVTVTPVKQQQQQQQHIMTKKQQSCLRAHLNSLWSVWYGLCLTGFQGYIATQCTKRFLGYAALPWPVTMAPPRFELHAYLGLVGASILILPFFLAAAVFKIGNLANDGFKLGRNLSTCTADPPTILVGNHGGRGLFRNLWKHGGPTAPFLHLTAAFCLLLPRLLMEARLIEAGFLSKDAIWRTDLDFMIVHKDRLVVLSFMTSAPVVNNSSSMPTPLSFASTTVSPEDSSSMPMTHDFESPKLAEEAGGPISPEFLNYGLALLVYAVRYPSVFWNTNKWYGALFSFQLLGNGIQSLLSFAGMSVLYKIQVLGATEALPLFRRSHSFGSPFLLDNYVTLALFTLSSVLVLASSLVLYLYGYGRFHAFLNTERERRVVILKEGKTGGWGYFTHCAALCVLVALAVCHAPLLHDYTVVYRGSLDGTVLACVVAAILHLFAWVLVWLILTVKQQWMFKLRVTVGRAAVRSARSVKLVTDVDLVSCTKHIDEISTPLLVVGNGRTYTVADQSPKKAIMNVIQKAAMERKAKSSQGGTPSQDSTDDDTDIYWLRPKPLSPACSPDSDRLNWFGKKINSSQKPKVTFDETTMRNGQLKNARGRIKGTLDEEMELVCEDDGDYATLRVGAGQRGNGCPPEETKLLEQALRDDSVTFARGRELQPDYEDPSPLLTPEPSELPLPPPPPDLDQSTVIVHASNHEIKPVSVTPRCLRRADSGMPHDELTPRSGSVSSGSQSGSGNSPPGAHNSESSSGVHSSSSSRRATSVDDLTVAANEPRPNAWKSCSLQRSVLPPGAPGTNHIYSTFAVGQNENQVQTTLPGVPAVILENPGDNTVVIRRKTSRPRTTDLTRPPDVREEPFGRSTNMRMTSFTDEGSSATLPHFPTQLPPAPLIYPCNTMPLPCPPPPPAPPVVPVPPVSCNLYPRLHTTIPTHHNGVRLFPTPLNTPYAKRLHHTGIVRHSTRNERDSANFSMASSGDSDSHS